MAVCATGTLCKHHTLQSHMSNITGGDGSLLNDELISNSKINVSQPACCEPSIIHMSHADKREDRSMRPDKAPSSTADWAHQILQGPA